MGIQECGERLHEKKMEREERLLVRIIEDADPGYKLGPLDKMNSILGIIAIQKESPSGYKQVELLRFWGLVMSCIERSQSNTCSETLSRRVLP